ncbi:unnamed protein product [Dibothriocephalus latus]|uniref:Uncharacterized protein n=1 Tax=Dibothriocephalus latus TaxID=60516 RepID=A0A3P7QUZ2_DIBLA|nr:unnamed protein product [Dibothriocephalus latus]
MGPVKKLGTQAKTRYLVAKARALEEDNEKLHAQLKDAYFVSAVPVLSI